jgi:ATP-dependent Lon protease
MKKIKIKNMDSMSLEQFLDGNSEFIPLMSPEDEKEMQNEAIADEIAILPLRNTVLLPGVVIPITAGRDSSIKLLKDASKSKKNIGVVAQKNATVDEPTTQDVYKIGTIARIMKVLKMPDGNVTVIIQGTRRFEIEKFTQEKPYFKAKVTALAEQDDYSSDKEFPAIISQIRDLAEKIIKANPSLPSEANMAIKNIKSDSFLINFIVSNLNLKVVDKQQVLDINDIKERALLALKKMNEELQRLELQNDIHSKTRYDLDKQQREYFLHQQMKTIQDELGGTPQEEEARAFKKKAKKKKWSKKTKKRFIKDLKRFERTNPQSPEYGVLRNYLELFLALPWKKITEDKFDLHKAKEVLDRDHAGLDDVKERILEYLAVLKLKGDMKSPIICLYGPPGVGKTSLGKSIAEAVGRKYIRMSLGGLRDEAEIRGHRKTYIGAMPGRIIQNIKKVKTSNPVFVLDEIDKLSSSHSGDPSSAILEVLDPEQNNAFYDNYLEMGYDLSKVMFIATANSLSTIQPALLDRMEIINVSGYTIEEKIAIAEKHLLPKQLKAHGITKKDLKLAKKQLEKIITGYTRESGVRTLEKRIAKIVRSVAKSIVMDEAIGPKISEEEFSKILGPSHERDKYENNNVAGVVTGLAWTRVGGDILFIESIVSKGSGLTLTGNLGKVMKESATLAMEYIKANAADLNLDNEVLKNNKIHIHVPAGATPKDGPSAGIAMLTSMVSSFTQRKVKANLAMTGEITLRGKVLPVGGIKEKILAAKRANIKEIILCKENQKDIEEIKADYIKGLKFHYVAQMSEVLEIALLKQKVKGAKKLK